jgi:hypothetical protein
MKIGVFKQLIKEAVVEAINEELPTIISEVMAQQNKQALVENRTISFNSNDVTRTTAIPTTTATPTYLDSNVRQQLAAKMGGMMGYPTPSQGMPLQVINKVDEATGERVNPYLAFIADAAANMSPMDKAGLRNLDS